MADSSSRQNTRTSSSLSRSHRGHPEPLVARRTGSSHRARPYHNPAITGNVSAIARHRAIAHQWSWLPTVMATWRIEEDIEVHANDGEYSAMDLSPYTQEPTHLTVPVLAARVHRHESRLHDMEIEQRDIRSNWMEQTQDSVAQLYIGQADISETINRTHDQMEDTVQTMEIVHNQAINNRNEISVLQSRLNQCETRLGETEDALRMVSRLAESVDHLTSLLPQLNLHRD